jgi:uncharacterized protein with HEPN domain
MKKTFQEIYQKIVSIIDNILSYIKGISSEEYVNKLTKKQNINK